MAAPRRKVCVGILFGGKSGEHEVSLSSAASVIAALDPEDYEITAIGITRAGMLANAQETAAMLPPAISQRVRIWGGSHGSGCLSFGQGWDGGARTERSPEIIFPVLHGPYGEDGTIQGLLEVLDVPYVGSGVLASSVGMDKDFMKRLFAQASLPIVPFRVEAALGIQDRLTEVRRAVEAEFCYPMFSKPANLGSSVGVRKIHDAGEFDAAVLFAAEFDGKVIIEQGIDARELECAVLGNEQPEASGVGEILSGCEFYDYEAKYSNPASRTQIPADIDADTAAEVRGLALRAFETIGASGLARVDFFLDRRTGKILLNEINTMPGFTSISMYPKLWAAGGLPFDQLIRRLLDLGFERHSARTRQVARVPVRLDPGETVAK